MIVFNPLVGENEICTTAVKDLKGASPIVTDDTKRHRQNRSSWVGAEGSGVRGEPLLLPRTWVQSTSELCDSSSRGPGSPGPLALHACGDS